MAIRIVDRSERWTWRWERDPEVAVTYRRLTGAEHAAVYRRHARTDPATGEVAAADPEAVAWDLLRAAVVGWAGVVDAEGAVVPYDPARLTDLPAPVLSALAAAVLSGAVLGPAAGGAPAPCAPT